MSKIWTWEEAEDDLFGIEKGKDRVFRKEIDRLYDMPYNDFTCKNHASIEIPAVYKHLSQEHNLPLGGSCVIRKEKIHKIMEKDEGHALSLEQVKELPYYLSDPLMVMKTQKNGYTALAVVLDLKGHNDQYNLAFIHMDKHFRSGETYSEIASVYVKNGLEKWIERNVDEVLYLDDREDLSRILPCPSVPMLRGEGAPYIRWQNPSSSSIDENILTRSELVNQYLENCQLNEYAAALLAKISPPENALNAYDKATKSIVNRLNQIEKDHPNASARGNFTRLLSQTANNAKNEKEWGGYDPCAHVLRELLKLPHITPEVLQKIAATPANSREAIAGSFIPNEHTLQANILGLNHSQSKDNGKGGRA